MSGLVGLGIIIVALVVLILVMVALFGGRSDKVNRGDVSSTNNSWGRYGPKK